MKSNLKYHSIKDDIRRYINIINEASQPQDFSMEQKEGWDWEDQLMRSWGPKAAAYMQKFVVRAFNSLYPNVPIRVKRDDVFVMATTNPEADIRNLDIDVFNQRDNPHWECQFIVSPLYHKPDKTPYLESMVS